jgi:hypothetical protein
MPPKKLPNVVLKVIRKTKFETGKEQKAERRREESERKRKKEEENRLLKQQQVQENLQKKNESIKINISSFSKAQQDLIEKAGSESKKKQLADAFSCRGKLQAAADELADANGEIRRRVTPSELRAGLAAQLSYDM